MRLLFVGLANLFRLLLLVLGLVPRALRARRRPPYVLFRLSGDVPYREAKRRLGLGRRRGGASRLSSLEALERHVRRMAADPMLKGVVLELEDFAAGPAKRAALLRALEPLRAAGKALIGYAVSADTGEYELLAQLDRVVMAPAGRLELTGYAAELTALGSALERVGVGAHFVRRGEHKTAPELFTRSDISPIQRQTAEALLDERYQALIEAISRGRRVAPDAARSLVDQGPYSAKRALEQGLVDALVSRADLAGHLEGKAGDDERGENGSLAGFGRYAASFVWPSEPFRPVRRKARLAVVPVKGMIVHGAGGAFPAGPMVSGSDAVLKALRSARNDRRACGVVLFIDSPGGSALGSELILEEVKRLAKKKPVVAYVDRVAASGGYMAALGAQEIWAAPSALLGSIGVFAGKFDLGRLFDRLGVRREVLAKGAHAGIHATSRPFTPGERDALEAEVEETYQAFLDHVSAARGISKEEAHSRGEGRVFSGQRALEAKLVDRVGLFDDACRRALELAQVARPFEVKLYGVQAPRFSWMRMLRQATRAHLYALWEPWLGLR